MARDGFDIFSPDPFGRDIIYGLSTGQEPLGLAPPPQGLPVDTRPYDRMQATPRGFISGLFSDVLGGTFNMPQMPRTGIPAVDVFSPNINLFNRLALGDVQKTAERISYGEPLATGQGMTLRPRDETIGAALTVAPFVGEAAVLGARGVRTGARMIGQEIADRVATGQSMLPSGFAEPRPSLFAVEPSPMMPKPQAPVSPLGFYSAAEQAAMNLQRTKGTGQSFLNDLMKAPDVKKDELQYTGLDEFLKDKPNVTKQEVTDYLANNKVDVEEVRLGETPFEDPAGIAKRKAIFDKYEPEIQQLYKDLDNVNLKTRNAVKVATAKYDEMLYQLNKDGYMPTAQDYEAFNLAEKELTQANRMRNDDIDIRNRLGKIQSMRDAEADAAYVVPERVPTKYGKYQLAGGENYREILLKLPLKEPAMPKGYEVTSMQYDDGTVRYFANTPTTRSQGFRTQEEAQAQLSETASNLKGFRENLASYQSSHFNEPNILAHMRVNDRVDADGKKMLLVEEIQSDWHQAGREKGYKGKGTLRELPDNYFVQEIKTIDGDTMYVVRDSSNPSVIINKDYNRQSAINGVINELNASSAGGVPDAPFKDTWYQLSLKRLLKYAADNGYERVGLTTGTQQAKRYDLGNEVDSINVESVAEVPNLQFVDIDVIGGQKIALEVENGVVREGEFAGKRLSDVVGKEMADKITNVAKGETKSLAGEDLRIGGEGMKRYYDEIYPKYLEKYGKKFDASVGETKIITEDNAWNMAEQIKQRGISDAQWRALSEEDKLKLWNDIKQSVGRKQEPVRYIDITPKMKESVGKGQPLFTAIPAGTLGLGGLEYTDPFANPLAEDTTR